MPKPEEIELPDREIWVDFIKGFAIFGVFFEHWFEGYSVPGNSVLAQASVSLLYRMGLLVHLFFFLSGFGLAVSILKKRDSKPSWAPWIVRRITKIAIPYWTTIFAIFAVSLCQRLFEFNWNIPNVTNFDLLAYLSFARNQYPSTHHVNPAFWFMPVIVQFYFVFPFLILLMEKTNRIVLLLVTIAFNALLVAIWLSFDLRTDHQSTFFGFHILPFVMGICFAKSFDSSRVALLGNPLFWKNGWPLTALSVFLGACFITTSFWLTSAFEWGQLVNDAITVLGVLLILLPIFGVISNWCPLLLVLPANCGRHSFSIYLIHYPVIMVAQRFISVRIGKELPALHSVGLGFFVFALVWCTAFLLGKLKFDMRIRNRIL